jgi:DNA-binding IscR family transcriptional regulator
MQIGSKFSIAIHILLSVEVFKGKRKVTSEFLSSSAHTNAVIIRKIMGQLRDAGLIEIVPGTGGITLSRKPEKISLRDIYLAIDPVKDGKLFKIHKDTEPCCPVGGNIGVLLDPYFLKAQGSMEKTLAKFSLKNLLEDLGKMTD